VVRNHNVKAVRRRYHMGASARAPNVGVTGPIGRQHRLVREEGRGTRREI